MKLFNKLSLIALGAIMTVGVSVGVSVGHDTVATYAADETSETIALKATTGNLVGETISWSGENVTFSNAKDKSGTAIRTSDTDHYRLYKDSKGIVECSAGSITNISITTTDSSYNTPCSDTLKGLGSTSTSRNVVTVVLTNPASAVEFSVTAQIRAKQIAITYTAGDVSNNVAVTLDKNDAQLDVGQTLKLIPSTKGEGTLTWSSNDTDVATVTDGLVTAVAEGDAVITATYVGSDNTATATCTVKVIGLVEGTVKDLLTVTETGQSGTTYGTWAGVTLNSSAVYAGNSAADKNSVQLRTKNNESGVVTTASGGYIRRIVIDFNSGNAAGRKIDIYGKTTAYTAATELYDSSKQGTKLGSLTFGSTTVLDITGDYTFVGLRSNDGATYCTSIAFFWEEIDTSADEAAAEAFATTFLNETHTVCETTQGAAAGEAPQAMKDVWTTLSAAYSELSATAKDFVKDNTQLITRYNGIMAKYTGLNDFLGTGVTALNNMTMFASNNGNTNVLLLVAIASLVAMGLVAVVIRRRKYNA